MDKKNEELLDYYLSLKLLKTFREMEENQK